MAKGITLTGTRGRRVVVASAPTRRVTVADVAEGLGAEVIEAGPAAAGSPANFAAIREEMFRRLRSTGGRPGLEGAGPRKIPLTDTDWRIVERVAHHISEPGFRPSVGQVAGVLLSLVLRTVDDTLETSVKRSLKAERRSPVV